MSKFIFRVDIFIKPLLFKALFVLGLFVFASFGLGLMHAQIVVADLPVNQFRVGEKLTYSVSFERYSDVAFAEIGVVSRGALAGKDAVELYSKIKTLDFVSAAYYLIDETRTSFAAVDSGFPLLAKKTDYTSGLPKETIDNFLTSPTVNYDLLSLLFKIRNSGVVGAATFTENGKAYNVTFQPSLSERVKTPAGDFETVIVSVQSDYLTEVGIKELRINLSSDEARIPALIRIKTVKGEFRAAVASIQMNTAEVPVQPTPTPLQTPLPVIIPSPTATPYIENLPLAGELAFPLGETLEYQITSTGRPVATFTLQAKERKEIANLDSLLLAATVTRAAPGNPLFSGNDFIQAQVDPGTLGPRQITIKFSGEMAAYNQTASFDPVRSFVTVGGRSAVEVPVGTHSILSLLYAVRSFNLKPSKDTTAPVNDTRVAVFWENRPYVFTLRPETADLITQQGEKVSAQLVTVKTGNPQLDALNIKIWLSNDDRRFPLRISAGVYQADLVSNSVLQLR
ncbi:MAG: DUF3108 domain-containing protein [Pyrinomonadaceae bacterium]